MVSLNDIRSTFLDFFARDGHEVVHSAPLVPQNDPTLLFVNAGMVPFKDYFTGAARPPSPRAASSQKCVRAGGKHNDLDNVGYTARHLTFFEMLGNFSFGDYFKDHAIERAWELVTKDFGLDPKRLLVTVYIDDDEAAAIWKKVTGFSDDKVIRIAGSDNFWAMGDNGPCGPCTEIFWDYGDHVPGGPPGSPDEDGDRYVEIWNNVFMQFEKENDQIVRNLPKPSVDTGMGLERISSVLQGKNSVFDTDLFQTLIGASAEATSTAPDGDMAASHRVIADHLRSSSFLIADGVTPSNEGRGYVLRRIMRRAMRHAHLLGAQDPLMHRLVPTLVSSMGEAYPELKRAQAFVEDTLKQEEIRFRSTLAKGMSLFEDAARDLKAGDMLDGQTAFTLYDTYGFPLDLTQDEARRRGFSVNVDGFQSAMAEQRARSREHWKGSGQQANAAEWLGVRDRLGPTVFTGYDAVDGSGEVLALMKDGAPADAAETGTIVEVLFDTTPFYAESGGQAGDHGTLEWPGGSAEVIDVRKQAGDLHVLSAEITAGRLEIGTRVAQSVDPEKRRTTRANHSAAHLLHTALKNVLGPHVAQKGQLVDAERARFDFSHNAPLSEAEIEAIEAEVNAVIRQNVPAETRLMAPQAAIEAGAIALFGEKYGDEVRVLTLGRALTPESVLGNKPYSVELCGGTPVARTGDIALFKIVQETGIAAGVRRVEALTGEAARLYVEGQARVARGLARDFKVQPADVTARVEALQTSVRTLEKQVAELKKQLALSGSLGGSSGGNAAPEEINGVKLIARVLDGVDGKGLRGVAEDFRKQVGSGVVALIGVTDGKAAVTVAVTADTIGKVNAADLARAAVIAMGGQGAGGKPDFAQGGAPDGSLAEAGLDAVRATLKG
ncbi:MAG: alanine--tRNA ligase [Brevundimonas sp.]|uniref:alanine--tRNA ligase n=1 Tax=Brevundimonas sp. TaxID=1871086 RepID=UPI00391C7385